MLRNTHFTVVWEKKSHYRSSESNVAYSQYPVLFGIGVKIESKPNTKIMVWLVKKSLGSSAHVPKHT